MSDVPFIWDGCGLLNLAATTRAGEILTALDCPCLVVAEVLAQEVLYLRPLPEEDPHGSLVPIDLSELFEAGLLQQIRLTASEQELFVEYARHVDDGEAGTAAAAVARGLRVATDDRAAIRLLRGLQVPPPVVTTPEWLKHWADTVPVDAAALGSVLRRVELCSRYHPGRKYPLHDWWSAHVIPS